MSNFKELLLEVLNEKNKSVKDLEDSGIIPKRTFYEYKNVTPYLETVLRIANFLNVSLDYLSNRTTDNRFREYSLSQTKFFETISNILKVNKISQVKFCKDTGISRPNFTYWKNGALPKFFTLISIADYLDCSIDDLLELK